VPIYLEWAPKGILNGKSGRKNKKSADENKNTMKKENKINKQGVGQEQKHGEIAAAAVGKEKAVRAEDVTAGLADGAPGDESIESTTIYVKNLSFKTEESALNKHFIAAVEAAGGSLRAAKVARSKTKDGRLLSSGFGFIECSSEAVAREVISSLQGSSLDGHSLALQLSSNGEAFGSTAKRKSGGSTNMTNNAAVPPNKGALKIVVRNLAFEASRKDILGLFTPFGAVKSCRLPRKFDGSLRGFAFVEFATPQEARGAVEAVSGTHLYGRRLVIEWAEDEGGLDELRAKTASGFRGVDDKRLVQQQQQQKFGGGAGNDDDEEDFNEEQPNGNNKKRRKK
jgi:multiple RNA-binding domain-containing protein 1